MDKKRKTKQVGYVISSKDYLLRLEGLPSVKINDIIEGGENVLAAVVSLDESKVDALILNDKRAKPGDMFVLKEKGVFFPKAENLIGRTISPLCEPIDGKGNFKEKLFSFEMEKVAAGIDTRERISEQFFTGMTIVDTLVPIGKGQRELIFGEPRSGKTSFILDVIAHQKGQDVICIYVSMGKSEIEVKRFASNIVQNKADSYTVVIAAFATDGAPLISIAPESGLTIAEQFQKQDKDVLLIFDDLGIHAKYLREIALLSERIPGRESYPGDIFYQHAHLMERAGKFTKESGGGSITLLPMIETNIENFTNLIPTNVIASTDGHLLFSSTLLGQGQYPPVDVERSVTRVGRQTQGLLFQQLSDKIRFLISDYQDYKNYSRFGSELTNETQMTLKRGEVAFELLKQEHLERIEPQIQIMLLTLLFTPFVTDNEEGFILKNKANIIKALRETKDFQNITASFDKLNFKGLIEKINQNLAVLTKVCQS